MAPTDSHELVNQPRVVIVKRVGIDLNLVIRKAHVFSDGSQFMDGEDRTTMLIGDYYSAIPLLIVTDRDENEVLDEPMISNIQIALEKLSDLQGLPFSPIQRVNEGTPFNSSGHCEEWNDSNLYALVLPQPVASGLGGSSSTGTMPPCLFLDSGATIHVVGDDQILTNLRDRPSGMVTVADGSRLAITKVGDIQMPDITIRDVCYVRGLKLNLISVRQLAKSKIVTIFYENHAELWLGEARIGGGILTEGLYKLRYLHER